jgi:polygalacturonase
VTGATSSRTAIVAADVAAAAAGSHLIIPSGTYLIDASYTELAVRALHTAYGLDAD